MKIIVAEYAPEYTESASKYNKTGSGTLNDKGSVQELTAEKTLSPIPAPVQDCPRIWMKADSSLLKGGKPMFIPDWTDACIARPRLWARIKHTGKSIPARFAYRYYDQVGSGVDFLAQDVLEELRSRGESWEKATGFDGAAVIGSPVEPALICDEPELEVSLQVNGKLKVQTIIQEPRLVLGRVIEAVSRFFTLREGDYLFLSQEGSEGVRVNIDDHLACSLSRRVLTEFNVK